MKRLILMFAWFAILVPMIGCGDEPAPATATPAADTSVGGEDAKDKAKRFNDMQAKVEEQAAKAAAKAAAKKK